MNNTLTYERKEKVRLKTNSRHNTQVIYLMIFNAQKGTDGSYFKTMSEFVLQNQAGDLKNTKYY